MLVFKHRGLTIEIHHDQDCESPRENDNLGTVIAWHRRYRLSDKYAPKVDHEDFDPTAYPVCLPVYMYDHSGVALSVGSFGDPWDSGQVGWIYASRNRILREYGGKLLTKKRIAQTIQVLKSEIEEYSAYLNGECYGYVIKDSEGNDLDSCWGYIGDYVKTAAMEAADWQAKTIMDRADALTDSQRSEN